MIESINFIGPRSCAKRIILWMAISPGVVFLPTSYASDNPTKLPTMVDVAYFMNMYSELPEYAAVKLTTLRLREKYNTTEVPVQFAKLCDKWANLIGKNNWGYFHHYSRGIQRFQEAIRIIGSSEKEEISRKHKLDSALEEFIFIERSNTDGSFPFWPQLYIYKYKIYSKLNQPVMALKSLMKANELQKKPGFRPPKPSENEN